MLIFRIFKNSINNSVYFKCKDLRFLSTQTATEIRSEPIRRKYLKPLSPTKLEPWGGSNLTNIFAGTIDKRVFVYPSVLTNRTVDTVLNHSVHVEDFFIKNRNNKLTDDTLQKFRKLELFGLSIDQKFGGAGYGETEIKFLLECAGCNPRLARFLAYSEDFGCRLVNKYGTEEQKNKYLSALAEGKLFMTLAFLENGPLIDLSKIEGEVISDMENKQFILNAEKKWVHYADKADIFLVLAKSSKEINDGFEIQGKFNIFIVENNLPGVQMHKINSPWAEEANLYDISFKDVKLPISNVLGGIEEDGFSILKSVLSHSNLTDATFCLSLMKQLFHDASQYIEENNLNDMKVRGHLHVIENKATFLSYLYALESVIYLVAASFDIYEKPDLFNDAIMAKALGIEFLQTAIKIYTEIIGYESFKRSEIMEQALNAIQHYSIFNENIEYFKLMSGTEGLISAAKILAPTVKVFRNQFENPFQALKLRFTMNSRNQKFKSSLNFKMELHSSLQLAANNVENCLLRLRIFSEILLYDRGNLAIFNEHVVSKLTELASYIFACIACLSRASDSICQNLNNHTEESLTAQAFIKMMDFKIKNIYEDELRAPELLDFYRNIGKRSFNFKGYPMEHPLSRAF